MDQAWPALHATSRRPLSQTCPPFTVDYLPEIIRINEFAPEVRWTNSASLRSAKGVFGTGIYPSALYASRLQSLLGQFER